ncbi:MAG: bifunctional [glutamate--ammonia ligase]-adenylyl-L-tyrosine phosphorylase/[glutamate--ammonia-ligase] adenylyltransferase [Xanthomonadales bacterium]|nr:bifunctional [glutamate--ammonia ligase]-adenylyl-L-tyrosine phosphorylase/[glutamate--ammonia-ligase] adenylyltransferase [Xanthomonadales bacterium]
MPVIKQNPAQKFSPFLNQLITRHPDWLEQLLASGRLESISQPAAEQLEAFIKKLGLDPALRQFRNREMMRLIWRDLNQLAPVDEILADLSVLADICLQAAIRHHSTILEDKHGIPRGPDQQAQRLVVIGLGKLGGGELNLSSDIDIIFCFPDNGVCDGRRALSNEQFFIRLTRQVIRSLSEITADGFCFRVDTRLRPFGESGPLVSSFAALEQYYQREGRDWERYAWIKARPVAGDLAAGGHLLGILKPFVYRRYIDFGAIEALRDMHANVREDARRTDRLDDIKRGPGGIRELEFLVQTFQLLRGGRDKALQTASIFAAVNELQNLRLLPDEVITELLAAYRFLRKTENRIQALHDQQTHQVPTGEDGLRVAQAMGFESMEAFNQALADTRAKVQSLFEQSLPQAAAPGDEKHPWHAAWQRIRNNIQQSNPDSADRKPLDNFVKRLNRLSLSQRASTRLDQFMPILLERFNTIQASDAVMHRVLDLVSAICRRSAYLSLLVQNPGATNRMLELFAASSRVAAAVTRYPVLLDELIDPSLGANPPTRADIKAGVKRILTASIEAAPENDTESLLLELNYFKQVIHLRVAVAVLKSSMSANEAASALSQLAQSQVSAVLQLAQTDMQQRHGRLPGAGLAVIAYGSLGACALGFDSDLDLIFLYQPQTELSDGARPIPAERYHTGVARRMLSLLSVTTTSGRLYSIDARLRPNGRSGLLVSSEDAFRRYQLEQAWVWELQALTRARPVAGNRDIAERFTTIRRQVLTASRDATLVIQEVLEMRQRLHTEHNDTASLKYASGGLLDIQFVVQLGLLLNAEKFPAVLDSTDLTGQLRALCQCGWINDTALSTLVKAHEQLSQSLQQASLIDADDGVKNADLLGIADALCEEILG